MGCGSGKLAVYLAKRGAHVTATDISRNAIERTRERAEANQVSEHIPIRRIDALKLKELGATYDLVVGNFDLHHIEPFEEFVGVVYDLLKEEGKAVFMENSFRNTILFRGADFLSPLLSLNKWIDRMLYRSIPSLRKYSYYQIVEASKR